jgi:ubiquinol-cytochrome c reductase cytochrome b subunit
VSALLSRVLDFLESRAGARALGRAALDEPVPGGARWSSVSGSLLAGLLAVEMLTGLVLALYYSPSVTTAWASIVFLEERIRCGGLVRALHVFGASAIVLAIAAHYLKVVVSGAYKKPRELIWLTGLLLLLVLFGILVTGSLLPFDQSGYWGTRVRMSFAGAIPGIGHEVQAVAQGGEEIGNLTLTHFYALHAMLLPALAVGLYLIHRALARKKGRTEPLGSDPGAPAARYFPGQAFRDTAAIALVLGALLALSLHQGRAPLEGPADPTSDYEPRPEWYFLPLFQLLKYFPGPVSFIGLFVIPGAVVALLFLLPFYDRSDSRAPSARGRPLLLALGPIACALGLGALAAVRDAADEKLAKHRRDAADDARDARAIFLKNGGVPAEGPLALFDLDPVRRGKRVFHESCAPCHALDGRSGMKGPDLGGYLSPGWLSQVIRSPAEPRFFGEHDSMGNTDAKPQELAALVEYVRSLDTAQKVDAARVEQGRKLFQAMECSQCHEVEGTKSGDGPNLAGYGSDEWLMAFFKKPGAPRFYGAKNRMTAFEGKLSDVDLASVVVYLRSPEVQEK